MNCIIGMKLRVQLLGVESSLNCIYLILKIIIFVIILLLPAWIFIKWQFNEIAQLGDKVRFR